MEINRNRRINKPVSPLGQNSITPDCYSKFAETVDGSHANGLKEFTESSPLSTNDYRRRKGPQPQNYSHLSLAEANFELDNNMNQIIYLLSKRKHLIATKKRRLKESFQQILEKSQVPIDFSMFEYQDDQEFLKVVGKSGRKGITVLGKVIRMLPEMRGERSEQEEKSEAFWKQNRALENQIDRILDRLKILDKNLEGENAEVHLLCKELDDIEDSLKAFVGLKSSDNLHKVEALFQMKKTKYAALNRKIKNREDSKDSKIDHIHRIGRQLEELKATREGRIHQIARFFGVKEFHECDTLDFSADLTPNFQALATLHEKKDELGNCEREVWREIQQTEKDQDRLYGEILKRQSDEAKAFHNYETLMNQKIKYNKILALLEGDSHTDPRELICKYREYKGLFTRLLEEDSLVHQGLVKTSETAKTFAHLLKATENQKERRHELLSLLETCIHRRGEYEKKREEMRNLSLEEAKNLQEMGLYEEELEAILTDGDIQSYKKMGNAIGKCEKEKARLKHLKEGIERKMESMDREVVGLANRVQEDYQDILADILPSDFEYSLKNGEDVKKLRNHLRKMYKRLGILSGQ